MAHSSKRDNLHRLLNTRAQIKDELSYYTMFTRSGTAGTVGTQQSRLSKTRTPHSSSGLSHKDRDVMSIVDMALNTPMNQMVTPYTATSGAPKGVIRLPIFRLPAATSMPVLRPAHQERAERTGSAPKMAIVPFVSYDDQRAMLKALLHFIQRLSPSERRCLSSQLALQPRDQEDCETFLRRKVADTTSDTPTRTSRVSLLLDFVPCEESSIFLTAKHCAHASGKRRVGAGDQLAELSHEIDLVKLGFPQSLKDFLVSERMVEARQADQDNRMLLTSNSAANLFQHSPYALKKAKKGNGPVRLRPLNSAPVPVRDPANLTDALVNSLTSVQKHAFMLKKTLEAAQGIVSVQDSKARQLMNMIGAERLHKALLVLPMVDKRRGWTAWRLHIHQTHREQRLQSILRSLVLRNVLNGLNEALMRIFSARLGHWKAFTVSETQRLRRQRIIDSTVLIQSAMRRYLANKRVVFLKQRKKYERLYDSTIAIQKLMRGKRMRWRYLKLVRETKEKQAAEFIQRVFRGYQGRKQAAWVKFKKNRQGAAILIQNMARARIARIRVRKIRRDKLERISAMKMQAIVRGFLARKNIALLIINRARYMYAMRIQAMVRGALTRMNRSTKIKEIQEYKAERTHAATKIQSAYRGYRSRILYRLMMFQWKQQRDRLHRAATQISRIIRGFLARVYLRDLSKHRRDRWIAMARLWQEMWSEEQQTWYYSNTSTGEAIWEPTRDGYTKFDGKLVLTSGEIIEDPANVILTLASGQTMTQQEADDKPKAKSNRPLCTECNDRIAIRKCQECGDVFCTKCYKALHALGARRHHTHTMLGPKDCEECELLLCERYCVSCDECFCDGCWRLLHSHGKRCFHPYSEVSPEGRIDSRVFTMDGEQLSGGYDVATYTQSRADAASANNLALTVQGQLDANSQVIAYEEEGSATGWGEEYYDNSSADAVVPADGAEWAEYYDDQGYVYYYNNVTGESTYDSPY